MARYLYLDNLKGLLIILVILGHAIQFTISDYQHVFLFRFIYSFHMPLFFMISGYLTFKTQYNSKLIQKRATQLLVPFVTWAFLTPILESGTPDVIRSFTALLYPDNGLWFLYNLFVYCAVFNLTELFACKGIRQEHLFAVAVLLLYLAMAIFRTRFNCSQLCWYLPFFTMGYYLRKYECKIKNIKVLAITFGGGYLTMMPFWMMREEPLFYQCIDLGGVFSYVYRYVVQALGAFCFFMVAKLFLNYKILFITNLGTKTLGFYAIQFIILFHLGYLLTLDHDYIKVIIETLTCISLCYVFCYIIERYKYTRFLLIGQK